MHGAGGEGGRNNHSCFTEMVPRVLVIEKSNTEVFSMNNVDLKKATYYDLLTS